MFVFGAFVIGTIVQEFFRGTRRADEDGRRRSPPVALVHLVRRNRRRYGGYTVHLGVAVALIGIAASTSFQHARRADLTPGQSVKVDGYTVHVRASDRDRAPRRSSRSAPCSRSITGGVTGHDACTRQPGCTRPRPRHSRSAGSSTATTESRVGLDSGLLRDIWVVIQPNTQPLARQISEGNAKFAKAIAAASRLPAAQRVPGALNTIYSLRDQFIVALDHRFVTHPWTSQFLIEVSPLVAWLWLGAIIAAFGGLWWRCGRAAPDAWRGVATRGSCRRGACRVRAGRPVRSSADPAQPAA